MILALILLSVLYLFSRLYRLMKIKRASGPQKVVPFYLPVRFFIEQGLYLSGLVFVLYALNPVPALIASAVAIGVCIDTLFTAYYYALKSETQ